MRRLCVFAGFAAFASAAQAQAIEERDCSPIYSARLAEAAVVARARLKSETARNLANQLDSVLGDNDNVTASLDARYSVVAAGGLMQSAYSSTIESYFCFLEKKWADDPNKLGEIEDARSEIDGALQDYFDASVWQIDAFERRRSIRRELENEANTHRFGIGEISSVLPKHNFDTVRLREITASANFPGFEASICAGILKRSIRAVDPTMLSELQAVRGMIIDYLERSKKRGKIQIWKTVNSFMNDQLTLSQVRTEEPLTRDKVVCVQKAAQAAGLEETLAAQQPATGQ